MALSDLRITKSLPRLKGALWQSLGVKLTAYQLTDESVVFTFRQIANPVGKPSQSVSDFLKETPPVEPIIQAYLPNRLLASVCTLRTAVQYWKYLELKEETEKAKNQARQLWSAAEHYLNSLVSGSDYLTSSDPNLMQNDWRVCNYFDIKILDSSNTSLRVLACTHRDQKTSYLIEVASFLELFGVESDWLARTSAPILCELQTYGLSQKQLTYRLDTGEEVLTFTLSDCLAICEFLIKRGNSRAADFLIALAKIPLEARFNAAFCSQSG